MSDIYLSVVVPVYNEQENIGEFYRRASAVLSATGKTYELIFTDDGSRDNSLEMLKSFASADKHVKVIEFSRNFGQHAAVMAGLCASTGKIVVTLDADLQNPPEDIANLLAEMDEGYDYVGSIRRQRNDSAWRHVASRAMNHLRERITRIKMTDQGCMMRAYDRRIIDAINQCSEMNTFIPALAYTFAQRPTEIIVGHEERAAGESKYSLYSLIRLNFDLMTGFSVVPLQMFSMLGMLVALGSGTLVLYLAGRRIFLGPEEGGLFTLFAIAFFLIGIALFGIGLLGEYVGRIYQEVRNRPRYLVQAVLEQQDGSHG